MVHYNSLSGRASRAIAMALAVIMVVSLVFAPALKASAEQLEAPGLSAEIKISDGGMDASIAGYLNLSSAVFALIGTMGAEGEVFADLAAYVSPQGLAVESVAFLDQIYGIGFENFTENLKNSVFAPDSGSAFALDEEAIAAMTGGLQAAAPITVSDETAEQLAMAVMNYVSVISDVLSKNMEMNMGSETITVGSKDIDTTAVTVKLNTEAANALVSAVLDTAAQDADLQAIAASVYDSVVSSGTVPVSPELEGVSGADLMASLWEQIPAAKEEIVTTFTESQYAVTVTVNTAKETGSLVAFTETIYYDDNAATVKFTMGESLKESEVISCELIQDGETIFSAVYRITENTAEAHAAEFVAAERDTENLKLAFRWEKAAGTYVLTMTMADETTTLTGKLVTDDSSIYLSADTLNGEAIMDELSLTLRADYAVEMPEFTEILTLSEEEMMNLLQTVMNVVGSFVPESEAA